MSNSPMNRKTTFRGSTRVAALALAAFTVVVAGCETDSFFDPSVVGRWEHTPIQLPILDDIAIISQADADPLTVTSVQPADLIPDMREYVIGAGDLVTVSVFELVAPGLESVNTRRVDETGQLRLPVIGPVRASGLSSSELEKEIRDVLERKSILRDAQVSVILQESRQNTFSVIGEPLQGGTAIGTYVIPRPNFRLLDALALARGVPGRTKKIFVIRQTALTAEVAGEIEEITEQSDRVEPAPPAPKDPSQLIDELMEGIDSDPDANAPAPKPGAPAAIEGGLDDPDAANQWVYAGGKWMKVEGKAGSPVSNDKLEKLDELGRLMSQRIIEIPYEQLHNGDMRYNIIVRPGDVIRVPAPTAGFVYIMGQISRPGAYTVPGEQDLTLKQLVASGGNLSALAIPERVDLVRRIGADQEVMLRLNLRAIFEGTEPDFFLKQDDLINVGTNWFATPLAIFRNGFRTTYGFGFILDKNFATEVFP